MVSYRIESYKSDTDSSLLWEDLTNRPPPVYLRPRLSSSVCLSISVREAVFLCPVCRISELSRSAATATCSNALFRALGSWRLSTIYHLGRRLLLLARTPFG